MTRILNFNRISTGTDMICRSDPILGGASILAAAGDSDARPLWFFLIFGIALVFIVAVFAIVLVRFVRRRNHTSNSLSSVSVFQATILSRPRPSTLPESRAGTGKPDKSQEPAIAKRLRPDALPEDPLLAHRPSDKPPTQEVAATPVDAVRRQVSDSGTLDLTPADLKTQSGETNGYHFALTSDIVQMRGDNRTRVRVSVRVESSNGEDASRAVTCTVQSSHPDKISCGPLRGNVQFDVWARHLGTQPFKDGTITVRGTAPNGTPLQEMKLPIIIQPVTLRVRLLVWKKGLACHEVIEPLERACAFLDGRVIGDNSSLASAQSLPDLHPEGESVLRADVHPVAFARCRAELQIGDSSWSAPRETMTDAEGKFRYSLPTLLLDKFGGFGVTEGLAQPLVLRIDPVLGRELEQMRAEIDRLPNAPALDAARDECNGYLGHFFEQLCQLPSGVYDDLVSCQRVLRASIVLAARYCQEYADQRPLFKRALGETFGNIVNLVFFTSGLLKSSYEWVAESASDWVQAVVSGYEELGIPRWTLRLVYAPARVLLRGTQRSVRWAFTEAIGRLSREKLIAIPNEDIEAVWEQLATRVHERIQSGYRKRSEQDAPGQNGDDWIAMDMLAMWEMIAWMVSAFWWFLMNFVLRGIAWLFVSGCQALVGQLDGAHTDPPSADSRKVFDRYVGQGLTEWGKEVDLRVGAVIDGFNRTGDVSSGLMNLSGILMNRVARVETCHAIAANTLHAACVRSRDRKVPAQWQDNLRTIATIQLDFSRAWQNATGWNEFLERTDRLAQVVVKTVVQGGAFGIMLAVDKMLSLIAQGTDKSASQSSERLAANESDLWTKIGDLPRQAADLLQSFAAVRVALKELMHLLAIKEGLPLAVALLYDTEVEEMTGPLYDPSPIEGEEAPEPLHVTDPEASAVRLARLVSAANGQTLSAAASPVAAGVDDIAVLKRVRDFLAQPDSPEEVERQFRTEATRYIEKFVQEAGIPFTAEEKQILIQNRIEILREISIVDRSGSQGGAPAPAIQRLSADQGSLPLAPQSRDGGRR